MLNPAFHFLPWNPPDGGYRVDLSPFGMSQFTGSDEKQRRKPKSDPGQQIAVIAIYRTQQTTGPPRFEDRGQMLRLAAGKHTPKVSRRIRSGELAGDGVA